MLQVHATCVAVDGVGVLLQGPPGSGKSDLALRLIEAGAALVADDRTEVRRRDGALWAGAPAAINGLLEVRGVGVMRLDAMAEVRLGLAVDLVATDAVERNPEAATRKMLGVALPLVALAPFEASAPAKVRLAALGTPAEASR